MFGTHYIIILMIILCLIVEINSKSFEGFIVGGELAPIEEYPHSAYLSMKCSTVEVWMCGGSILNQDIILTAAHCLCSCDYNQLNIFINIGSTHKRKGTQKIKSQRFLIHENYNVKTYANDIGLIKVIPKIIFSSTINRVAIMKNPPKSIYAQVAGWGAIDDVNSVMSYNLQKLSQKIWTKSSCENIYGSLPVGTICASSNNPISYIAKGDSGSALVVNGYIEIGLVSFKKSKSRTLIVYTDVSYYYGWINHNAKRLICQRKK